MIFQNPRAALNPIRTVGRQIQDVLVHQAGLSAGAAWRRAAEMLATVKIADPERRMGAFPFELSGGMCQRIMIALALACTPALLIADEPTTGLDVTTQATVLSLVKELAVGRAMATVLITHDLGLAAEHCDRIMVMHAGHVVEAAPTAELFARPAHPYTRRLISATPRRKSGLADLVTIEGALPDLRRADLPPCRYSERCELHIPICDVGVLPIVTVGTGHTVSCRRAS
ncbi:MAG: ABC transporter ATP-binding protein [Pseudomonadota bacterium]